MRIPNSLVRSGVLCGLTLGAYLVGTRPAAAEVTLVEKDGWTFFTDGRINAFGSLGFGDDFPQPTRTPTSCDTAPAPQHTVLGSGQPFTAGFSSDQGNASGKYFATRVRSGFLGSILAFGMKRQLSETTTVKAYISLWGTAQAYARDRTQDLGNSNTKGFDVREGYVNFEGPWGGVTAGHQSGLLGGISTEIDYLYGHNYGLGLPCLDVYYPTCGHIGTGALGAGTCPGIRVLDSLPGGLKLRAGLYDPVRLLGVWERVPYPRPEGYAHVRAEGLASLDVQAGGRGNVPVHGDPGVNPDGPGLGRGGGGAHRSRSRAPRRFCLSRKGLGVYVALQNSGSTFSNVTKELRYFTGLYAQGALVFGRAQVSVGGGPRDR